MGSICYCKYQSFYDLINFLFVIRPSDSALGLLPPDLDFWDIIQDVKNSIFYCYDYGVLVFSGVVSIGIFYLGEEFARDLLPMMLYYLFLSAFLSSIFF